MNSARVLYHMVRADFLERVRRYSFLLTLAGALWVAYGVATEEVWIVVGNGYRGVYNSAWIGTLMAICCSTFLSIAGFYIEEDEFNRLWQSDQPVFLLVSQPVLSDEKAEPLPPQATILARDLGAYICCNAAAADHFS